MKSYRALTIDEIVQLKAQACMAEDWNKIQVSDGFRTAAIYDVRFSGEIRLGAFDEDIVEHDGFVAYSGIRHATLHNVTVGDSCLIENVGSFISNYEIGDQCYIRNIGSMMTTGRTAFGNGTMVAALNEGGGRSFPICEGLSAQAAYVMVAYRYRPDLVNGFFELVKKEVDRHVSDRGQVGDGAFIVDTRQIVNVNIGAGCTVNGATKLTNGSLLNEGGQTAEVGADVIAQDFILSGGAVLDNGATVTRCFIGQGSHVCNRFTATDSFIASNCHFENGEACSIFAGPFTVSHHKSTLLIAGMYSFMNAGSATNQSNHLYKTGPIHQGVLDRGTKTASSSYMMWPSHIGAFSMVMGHHNAHLDTTDLPFSYILENQGKSYIVPGINLLKAGTLRDSLKWPQRDKRVKGAERDLIRFDLLNPFVMQRVNAGYDKLSSMWAKAGQYVDDEFRMDDAIIRRSALKKGMEAYKTALNYYFGQVFARYLRRRTFASEEEFAAFVAPKTEIGRDEWVDLAGFIAPMAALEPIWKAVEAGQIENLDELQLHLQEVDEQYDDYAWAWAYPVIRSITNIDEGETFRVADLLDLVDETCLQAEYILKNVMVDVNRELAPASFNARPFLPGYGLDGDWHDRIKDVRAVRCTDIQQLPFVRSLKEEVRDVYTEAYDVWNCLGPLWDDYDPQHEERVYDERIMELEKL